MVLTRNSELKPQNDGLNETPLTLTLKSEKTMKKTIKIISITVGFILILLIAGPLVVAMIFDPNDYKPEITKLVQEQTGRQLTINGDLNYSVFPWLGLSLGQLSLSNSSAPGFSKKPFAEIKSADVRIKIMPLFSSKIEVDKIVLAGLALSLEKNKQGISNWDDLITKTASNNSNKPNEKSHRKSSPAKTPPSDKTPLILPAIAGIELIDANINWQDKQLGQQYQLNDFNFTTGIIANNTPSNIDINFSFKAKQPDISGSTKLLATVTFNIEKQKIELSNIKLIQQLNQKIQKPDNIELVLTADSIKADLTAETAAISTLQIASLGVKLNVSLTANNILSKLKASGTLSSNDINPKALLNSLQITLPKMADSRALEKTKFDIRFSATPNSIKISTLKLTLDDSNLNGKIALTNFTKPKLRYTLNLNEINVDRYLPPPVPPVAAANAKKSATTSPTLANPQEQPLPIPVALLRSLDIKGSFSLGKAIVSKLKSSDIKLNVTAKNGAIRLNPMSAKMYGGQYQGNISLNVQKKIPVITLNEKITGVSFAPLVSDFMGEDYISGKGNASAKLTTKGLKISALTKNLNGTVAFNIKNSKIKYLNPVYLAKKSGYKLIKKEFKEKQRFDNPDVFKVMKGSFQIKNGIAHNRDFITESRDVNLDGKGYVDLVKRYINYDARIIFQKDLKIGNDFVDRQLKPLTKHPIPFPISGPFDNIQYNEWAVLAELTKLHEQKAKLAVKNKVDAEKKKLTEKKKKAEQDLKKRLEKDLKKKLGNLFK